MTRTFIEVPIFTKKWKELGFTDENLRELQKVLLDDPKAGDAIQGTGGLQKNQNSNGKQRKRQTRRCKGCIR